MADLTPIEEYNKKLLESGREIQKSTDSLRTPFKQLVGRIQETNAEFAKIAADNIGQTQDTWKGLITQGKKDRLIKAQEKDKEFKSASAAVKRQEENQAILETKKQELEEEYIEARRNKLKNDNKGENSLRALNEEKLRLEKKFNRSSNADKAEVAKELEELASKISSRESNITKILDSEKDRELEAIDDRIKNEQIATREQRKYIDDTNATLQNELEKASKTENYDKFTKGIKTLSGGLIDIAGVLDPIAETWGAFRDVSSVIATPFKAVAGGIGNFFKDEKEDLQEQNDELAEKNKKNAETTEKSEKGMLSWIKKLGVSGVLMLALAAAIVTVLARFTDLDNWIKTLTGNKDEDARDELTELTKVFRENLQKAETQEEKDKLTKEFKEKQDELLERQRDRVEQTNIQDGLDVAGDALITTGSARMSTNVGTYVSDVADGWQNPETINPNTGKDDKRMKKKFSDRLKSSMKKVITPKKMMKGNVLMTVAGTGLTMQEIYAELEDIEDARGKIEYLNNNGILTPEEYDQALLDLDEMESEAVEAPTAMAIAGALGSIVIGGIASLTGVGATVGVPLAIAGGMTIAAATGITRDMTDRSDDRIYDLLESKGFHVDPDKAGENLEFMENLEQETSDMIENGTNNLKDVSSEGRQNPNLNTVQQNNTSSSTTNFVGGQTPPQNLDQTNLALNFTP